MGSVRLAPDAVIRAWSEGDAAGVGFIDDGADLSVYGSRVQMERLSAVIRTNLDRSSETIGNESVSEPAPEEADRVAVALVGLAAFVALAFGFGLGFAVGVGS